MTFRGALDLLRFANVRKSVMDLTSSCIVRFTQYVIFPKPWRNYFFDRGTRHGNHFPLYLPFARPDFCAVLRKGRQQFCPSFALTFLG